MSRRKRGYTNRSVQFLACKLLHKTIMVTRCYYGRMRRQGWQRLHLFCQKVACEPAELKLIPIFVQICVLLLNNRDKEIS